MNAPRIPNAPAYVTTREPIAGPLPTWRETVYPVRGIETAMRVADRMREAGYPRVRVITTRPTGRRYLTQQVRPLPREMVDR